MPFLNEQQKEVFLKVKHMLVLLYGERNVGILKDAEGNDFTLAMYRGSTDVQTNVYMYKNTQSVVTVSAVLTYQTPKKPEVLSWIATKNVQIMFGGLCYNEYKEKPGYGNVVFFYDIFGPTVTKEELENAIENAALIADSNDDYIVQNFGGLTTQQSLEGQKKKTDFTDLDKKEKWE